MKKFLKIFGIIFILLIAAIVVLPIAFKGKIIDLIKTEANKQLTATLDFEDVSLSLISNFPDFTLEIEGLYIEGAEEFKGVKLIDIDELGATLDFMSVVSGDEIVIKNVWINSPEIDVRVLKDGTANYDITKESEESEPEVSGETTESAPLSLAIERYSISKGKLIYDDHSLATKLIIEGLDHSGQGDYKGDLFNLSTNTAIQALTVDYEGIGYLNKSKISWKADLAMDLEGAKYSFLENELYLNDLGLHFDGWLAMPSDDIDMDITFNMVKTDLKSLISLIPAVYASDMEGLEASGDVAFDGFVKGVYNDESMPGYAVNLLVGNGRVHYTDLPGSIQNIAIDAHVNSPEGNDMDALAVMVNKFYLEWATQAGTASVMDASLKLTNPMTNPNIDTRIDADVDFGSLKEVIPMEGDLNISGTMSAHAKVKGTVDDITNNRFNNYKAEGKIGLDQFAYADSAMKVSVPAARVELTPAKLNINQFDVVYDEIEMSLTGYMEDYVLYALSDTTLRGRFDFEANEVNLNNYMTESGEETFDADTAEDSSAASDTVAMGIFLVPENLDITLNAKVSKVIYDNLTLDDLSGNFVIADEIAQLKNVKMNALGGSIGMAGSYNTQDHAKPWADFTYDIQNVDVAQMVNTFATVEKVAPIAKQASGAISSKMEFKTSLDSAMNPIYDEIDAKGSLTSKEIVVEGGEFMTKLSKELKSSALAKQKIKNLNVAFVIEDGKITTTPFDVKMDNDISANIGGYSTFDNKIEYLMKMKVPTEALGGDFNKMAESLLASANAFIGGNMTMGEYINVDVRVHGALDDPKVSPSLAGMGEGESLEDTIKETINDAIDKEKEELERKAREEAEKQAAKILADAQKQADDLVKEAEKAGDKLRKEAEKQAKKLVDDAKNPIAKQAAKIGGEQLVKEADKQAKNLVAEAQKQGDAIMAEARKQAERIKNE